MTTHFIIAKNGKTSRREIKETERDFNWAQGETSDEARPACELGQRGKAFSGRYRVLKLSLRLLT